jgi:hypothetical protein
LLSYDSNISKGDWKVKEFFDRKKRILDKRKRASLRREALSK